MIKHLTNFLLIGLGVFALVFTIPVIHNISKSKHQHQSISEIQGEVAGANSSFILIKFPEKIIT